MTRYFRPEKSVAEYLSADVRDILTSARLRDPAPRTPGFLINYGLPARIALALIRGGWSTVHDLDTAERAWHTAAAHGTDCSFHRWLRVPLLGIAGANELRDSLAAWRDGEPGTSTEPTRTNHITAAIRADIAAGTFEHGQTLPNMAHLGRKHGGQAVDVGKACHMLVLAGWCGWRRAPAPEDERDRRLPVALVPGTPYELRWAPTMGSATRGRAADAAELLRHNPGAWQDDDSRHTLRGLTPISEATLDDAHRMLTIDAVSRRGANHNTPTWRPPKC
jgi:hypothetical protein